MPGPSPALSLRWGVIYRSHGPQEKVSVPLNRGQLASLAKTGLDQN